MANMSQLRRALTGVQAPLNSLWNAGQTVASSHALQGAQPSIVGLPLVLSRHSSGIASSSGAKPASRLDTLGPKAAAAPGAAGAARAAAESDAAAASATALSSAGFMSTQSRDLAAIPTVPKLLGFAGAIPFLTLNPYFVEMAGFPMYIQQAAQAQVSYGALIVSFLGAVHWGVAMTTSLSGARAAAMMRERYTWSVFPSLAAWPALMMPPAPASLCVALMLAICYLSDRSYARLGSLPSWYLTLRTFLTLLAFMGTLATTSYFVAEDVKRVEASKLAEQEEAARRRKEAAEKEAEEAAAAAAAAAVAAAPAPKKKGWW